MLAREINENTSKFIRSSESTIYFDDDVVYKVFHNWIDIKGRSEIIKMMKDNNPKFVPLIYDYIYDNGNIIGYVMKNYRKALSISRKKDLNLLKDLCSQLIYDYMYLRDNYGLCYFDYHEKNVLVNDNSILLLDIDSCLPDKAQNRKISSSYLCDYILSLIYNTSFFDWEIYYRPEERLLIRNILYQNLDGSKILSLSDLLILLENIRKKDVRMVLRKVNCKMKKF